MTKPDIFLDFDMLAEAIYGDPDQPAETRPYVFLRDAIAELNRRGPADDDRDQDAYWLMVRELENMLIGVSAAIEHQPQ